MAAPFDRSAALWTDPTDYTACLSLADAARGAGISVIRYRSVRDPQGRANVALLTCGVFAGDRPTRFATWRLAFSDSGVAALCDWPEKRISLPSGMFSGDPRMSPRMKERR